MRKIKLPYKNTVIELAWNDDKYEGMIPESDNSTILMYNGREFVINLSMEELDKELFPEIEVQEGQIDVKNLLNGGTTIDKQMLTELLSVDVDDEHNYFSRTSIVNWNNPVLPYSFSLIGEDDKYAEDWGDLFYFNYEPCDGSFYITFGQNEQESCRHSRTPYEFLALVFEAFGDHDYKGNNCNGEIKGWDYLQVLSGKPTDGEESRYNKITYSFPIARFDYVRRKVIQIMNRYKDEWELCCGWTGGEYCPHHTEEWERV